MFFRFANKQFFAVLLFLFLILFIRNITTIEAQNIDQKVEKFLLNFTDKIVDIGNSNEALEVQEEKLRILLRESIDMNRIIKMVLGKYYDELSDTQKKECKDEFSDKMLEIYINGLSNFKGIKEITYIQKYGKNSIFADTINKFALTQLIPIRYMMTFDKDGDSIKIFDLIIEDKVSFVSSVKDVVQQKIEQLGLEEVLPELI
ncbi:ABC transporter substrate-binding protein [Anaplasmataceae bacterium AB001_6]|nr:ABC transporter substrate-binding protein [Anaplasmataceae bacterium AB001_6]